MRRTKDEREHPDIAAWRFPRELLGVTPLPGLTEEQQELRSRYLETYRQGDPTWVDLKFEYDRARGR